MSLIFKGYLYYLVHSRLYMFLNCVYDLNYESFIKKCVLKNNK